MIKVHGLHGSPFVRKVFIMLEMKGVDYEIVPTMPFSGDKEYLKTNPTAKVPALVDGDLTIGDSKVICRYLEEKYPEPPLYPKTLKERALADWYEEYAATDVSVMAAGIFFQRFMRPFAFKQEPDEELIANITEKKLPPALDYLESRMPEDGFIFGDFTIADLTIISPFINASYAKYEVDAEKWPKLRGLIERVKDLPEVQKILGEEAKTFGF